MDMDITTRTFDERDEFRRKSIAEKAIKLLKSDIDISPMVIDGGWGTGKTEFCHKLINLMKEDDTHSVIYIDAFKADHINEPLMTVLAEIIKILPNESTRERFIKKVLPTVRFSLKSLAKAGISHLLRQDFADVAEDFTNEIEEATDKAIDATAELILKEHVEAEKNLQTLQAALTAISSQNPIVIFIDELDRCRPNFAIDMLEMIKHTFDVKDVSFVLITNTQQLKASINHCYGQAVDARRYLDKFIKFRFELSPHSDRSFNAPILAAKRHFFELARQKGIVTTQKLSGEHFENAVEDLIKSLNLSLREVETLILHIEIAQNLSDSKAFDSQQHFGTILLNLVGVALVCFEPDLLREIKEGIFDAKELGKFLGVAKTPNLSHGRISELANRKPKAFEVLMVILSKDYNKNKEIYTPSVMQSGEWVIYIESFMGHLPHDGEAKIKLLEIESLMSFD